MSFMRAECAIPMAELHCHIEGTLTPGFIERQRVRYQAGALDELLAWRGQHDYRWDGARHWMPTMHAITTLCLRSADDYRAVFDDYFLTLSRHGALYAEPSVALERCQTKGIAPAAVLAAAGAAMRHARTAYGIESGLLIALDHRTPPDVCYALIDLGREILPREVVGIDLHGLACVPKKTFADVFAYARRLGLGTRAHAGEFDGPDSVWDAIDLLGVQRIAHGVRASEDPDLMKRLARDRIALDMSVSSNVALGIVDSWESHPAPAFVDAGIPVSLSTDDPMFFSPTIAHEYARARTAFAWSAQDVLAMGRQAVANSFASRAVKAALLPRFECSQVY